MKINNVNIITIDHTKEYYQNAIERLNFFNLEDDRKVSFSGEKGFFLYLSTLKVLFLHK